MGLRQEGFERPLCHKAMLLIEMGELAGARHAVLEALSINPDFVTAWHLKAMLKTFTPGDPELASLERLLERADTLSMTGADRIKLRFALGKAWLDTGEPERAFAHLEHGNRLKRATFEYDSAGTLARIDALKETFTQELLQRFSATSAGHPTEAPVFVIGMPRSGTTLVEQMLASHPLIQAAGELAWLPKLVPGMSSTEPYPCPPVYPPLLADMPPARLTRLGREYESQLRELYPDQLRVIDKAPLNFLYAGFIHLVLPNARMIHCRRDPLDTCLSCYLCTFNGDMAFAYDQTELGSYYRRYQALADHWLELLPRERYTEVRYEDMVESFESEARRLVEFCGVPWSEDCLGFHQSDRQVRTASAIDVRKPVYRSSVGRSRAYADHLRPLIDALAG